MVVTLVVMLMRMVMVMAMIMIMRMVVVMVMVMFVAMIMIVVVVVFMVVIVVMLVVVMVLVRIVMEVFVLLFSVDSDLHVGTADAAGNSGGGLHLHAGQAQAVHGAQEALLVLQQLVQGGHEHIARGPHITFKI